MKMVVSFSSSAFSLAVVFSFNGLMIVFRKFMMRILVRIFI